MGLLKSFSDENKVEYSEQAAQQVNTVPTESMVTTAVLSTGLLTANFPNGVLYIVNATDNESGMYILEDSAVITTAIYANANVTAVKDTASKLNIYVESGEITIQNNTAGTIDVTLGLTVGGLDVK